MIKTLFVTLLIFLAPILRFDRVGVIESWAWQYKTDEQRNTIAIPYIYVIFPGEIYKELRINSKKTVITFNGQEVDEDGFYNTWSRITSKKGKFEIRIVYRGDDVLLIEAQDEDR